MKFKYFCPIGNLWHLCESKIGMTHLKSLENRGIKIKKIPLTSEKNDLLIQ